MKSIDSLFPLKSTFKNITFYYDINLEKSVLNDLANFLNDKISNLKNFLQFDSEKEINIYLFSDVNSFQKNYLEDKCQTSVIISSYENNIYSINPKKILDRDYIISLGVIASRCINILLNDKLNIKLPRWVKEGIVKYFGNKADRCSLLYNRFNKINIETVKSIIIDDNDSIYNDFKGYIFCQLVIEFLIEKYSKNVLRKIINNNESSIFHVLDIESEKFCNKLLEYFISQKYLVPSFLNLSKVSPHFSYYFSKGLNEKTLNDIINKLENNYDYVCDIGNLSISEKGNFKTKVLIYDSIDDFHYDVHNKKCDNWFTGECLVDIICTVNPCNTLPYHDYDSQLASVLHEFIHIVTLRDNVMRAPWLKEGVALYFANPAPIYVVKKKYFENPLNDKDLYILFGNDYRMFQINGGYIYSHTIIDYIIKTYSLNVLKVILTNPQKSPFEILEINKKDFCYNWLEFFKREYISK